MTNYCKKIGASPITDDAPTDCISSLMNIRAHYFATFLPFSMYLFAT